MGPPPGSRTVRVSSGTAAQQLPPPSRSQLPPPRGGATRAELRVPRDAALEWLSPRSRLGSLPRWRLPGTLVVVVLLVALALSGVFLIDRMSKTPAPAVLRTAIPTVAATPGAAPKFPWPAGLQSAVSIPELGLTAQSGPEKPVPVASLTKMMTAYIVLRDHPLPAFGGPDGTGNGPEITIVPADVAEYENDYSLGETSVEVQAGERLTERQLLQGLLIHSANNLSVTLARWDAGSVPAFVAKMNATAAALGMHSTHYADTSGYDPASQSTPADLLKVAAAALQEPAFAQTVTMSSVTLPYAGTIGSYTPLLGVDGVVGVKSGFMSAAGACDVMADVRMVDGHAMTMLASVVGVQGYDSLNTAGGDALNLARAAASAVDDAPVVTAGQELGVASADGHHEPVVAARSVSLLAWPGTVVARTVTWRRVLPGAAAGAEVGTVRVTLGPQTVVVPAGLGSRLPPPTLVERLF